jgi:hypothetical protein
VQQELATKEDELGHKVHHEESGYGKSILSILLRCLDLHDMYRSRSLVCCMQR